MTIEYINGVASAPKAIGPYSQAVKTDNLLFLSGQIPLIPETGQLAGDSIEIQTEQVLKNILALLKSQNLNFSNVAKSTIFLMDFSHFKTVNSIYEKWLGDCKPARSTVQVAGLPLSAMIEIEMIAVIE